MGCKAIPLSLIITALVVGTESVSAECVRLPAREMAKQVMESPNYEVVFVGTVLTRVRTSDVGYRATFDVDRVWKGSVTRRFDLYVWELLSEIPEFELGESFMVLGRKIVSGVEQKAAGVPSGLAVAFAPVGCSEPLSLDPALRHYFGTGSRPKQ